MTMATTTEHKDGRTTNYKRVKVAIVGAGASGLQCAHSLLETTTELQAEDIVLLEARDRIGGRIWTGQESIVNVEGTTVELTIDYGAAWIHGTGFDWNDPTGDDPPQSSSSSYTRNPLLRLLHSITPAGQNVCHTHLRPIVHGNPWIRPQHVLHHPNEHQIALYVAGQKIHSESPLIPHALRKHFDILQQVANVGNTLYECGKGADTIHQSLRETIDTLTRKNETNNNLSKEETVVVEALISFYQHLIECWYGASASQLQLGDFVSDECTNYDDGTYTEGEGDFYGPHCTMRKGMKSLLEPLLEQQHGVAESVHLNQEVTKVRRKQTETTTTTIVVETASGWTVEADCCVVTLPIGCLKQQAAGELFEPALPPRKLEAIQCFHPGVYKKVFLTFDRIFWPTKEAFLGMYRAASNSNQNDDDDDDGIGNCLLFDNLWAREGIPCIEAILVGDAGRWATNKSDSVIRKAVLEFMQQAMGLVDEPTMDDGWCIDCHVTRWEEDRFSQGAYSNYVLGTLPKHTEDLACPEWDGRLVFAGEATVSEYEGSVHAAILSGQQAARSIQEYLGNH